jgi:hypothetical protein
VNRSRAIERHTLGGGVSSKNLWEWGWHANTSGKERGRGGGEGFWGNVRSRKLGDKGNIFYARIGLIGLINCRTPNGS